MKNYLKIVLLCSLFIFNGCIYIVSAQDIQFTQYYASGTFLNPAFTGSEGCNRFSSINRKQWNSFSGGYTTNILTIEIPITREHNAVGLSLLSDVAGSGKLYSRSVKGLYSYTFFVSRKHAFVLGIDGAYTFRGADYSSYLFSDQIVRGGDVSSVEISNLSNTSYLDFSSGALYYSDKYWIGISGHHLNRPNQSLTSQEAELPIKYSMHGGYKFKLGRQTKDIFLSPSFNYKAQSKYDQFDLGIYYDYDGLVFGVWYRGIPVFKSYQPGEPNNDAASAIIGYSKNGYKVGYSYDITISKLTTSSAGSHELTFSYTHCSKKKKRKRKHFVPCAKF